MRKSAYHKGARGIAEKYWAKIIKTESSCDLCNTETIDPAHIFKRGRAATSTDLRCGMPLCRRHHSYYEVHPKEWEEVARAYMGDSEFEELRFTSRVPAKIDWVDRADFLKDVYTQITAGELTLEEAREYEKTYWS